MYQTTDLHPKNYTYQPTIYLYNLFKWPCLWLRTMRQAQREGVVYVLQRAHRAPSPPSSPTFPPKRLLPLPIATLLLRAAPRLGVCCCYYCCRCCCYCYCRRCRYYSRWQRTPMVPCAIQALPPSRRARTCRRIVIPASL